MILSFREWGKDNKNVVMLTHAGRDSSATWSKVGPWLGENGWHAIAVDLRGHGLSSVERSDGDVSLSALGNDLVETLNHILPSKRFVDAIISHSFGALVAMKCVSDHPNFCRFLVIEDFPGPSFNPIAAAEATERLLKAAHADPGNAEILPEKDSVPEDQLQDKVLAASQADPHFLPEVMRTFVNLDMPDLIRSISIPTLLVVGRDKGETIKSSWPDSTQYSLLSGSDRVKVAGALQNGTVIEISAGHYVHTKAFDSFVDALSNWLSPLVGTRSA